MNNSVTTRLVPQKMNYDGNIMINDENTNHKFCQTESSERQESNFNTCNDNANHDFNRDTIQI